MSEMKLYVSDKMSRMPSFLYGLALRSLVRSFGVYHPVSSRGRQLAIGERGCEDRWQLIREQITRVNATTLIDLGCAEGYFVRRAAAQTGCVALGVDGDVRRLMIAQTAAVADGDDRAGFMFAQINPDFLRRLPVFDVVLYQSVMHHVMYEHGIDHSLEILQLIRRKTAKALIFDMGQSNETASAWARLLPDMGSDPHAWIQSFIKSAGFSDVRKIGETDAYREKVRRAIFVAMP